MSVRSEAQAVVPGGVLSGGPAPKAAQRAIDNNLLTHPKLTGLLDGDL